MKLARKTGVTENVNSDHMLGKGFINRDFKRIVAELKIIYKKHGRKGSD